jgi:DUF4097 and DUF4098 domain-containing protein YvlB
MHRQFVFLIAALIGSGAALAHSDVSKINGTVEVSAGERTGDVSTVNGAVHIGDGATVDKAGTVNGSIQMGDNATANELDTVNGSIAMGRKSRVSGTVETVNGGIRLAPEAEVGGHLSNVNGMIELDAAHAARGLETVGGDITVGANSRVEGGIVVKKPNGGWFSSHNNNRVPRIVIGPGAVVQGTMDFEHEVELHVSDRATVGTINGARAIKFSGDRP